ncbi:MAG: LPXTG cell wall anchor domain-containing protein [Longicatena sp.]
MATTAFAAEFDNKTENGTTVITAQVPVSHEIKTQTDGNGKIYFNGVAVERVIAERLSTPKVLICPESGFTIDKVMLGDEDITSKISGGYYVFDAVYKDSTLKATFKKVENSEFKFLVVGTITKNGSPAADIALELRSDLKTYTTGKDGKFGFKEVEEGHHTLTAIQNGKIVGFTEFYLTRTDSVQNFKIEKNSDGSFIVKVNKNFAILELNFNITDDAKLDITSATATNNAEDVKDYPNTPQTGDNSNMMLLFALTLASSGILTVLYIGKKRRKSIK